MTALIVTASRHGSTREIAERVAEVLRTTAQTDTVVEDVAGAAAWLDTADAVVVAAPVYGGKLEKSAKAFLDSRRAELSQKSLVILYSGASPAPNRALADQLGTYGARDVKYLRGALVEERLGALEKLQIKLVKGRYGDFRDWNAVEHWAKGLSAHGVN